LIEKAVWAQIAKTNPNTDDLEEVVMTKLQKDHLMILLESIESKVQFTVEAVSTLNNQIDTVRDELKEDISVLDYKIMGLSKRVDAVDKKVDAVYNELVAHRNDTELHSCKPKRTLKRV
jgi:tetrahydromethanopterin S-methyltransferase subunit G